MFITKYILDPPFEHVLNKHKITSPLLRAEMIYAHEMYKYTPMQIINAWKNYIKTLNLPLDKSLHDILKHISANVYVNEQCSYNSKKSNIINALIDKETNCMGFTKLVTIIFISTPELRKYIEEQPKPQLLYVLVPEHILLAFQTNNTIDYELFEPTHILGTTQDIPIQSTYHSIDDYQLLIESLTEPKAPEFNLFENMYRLATNTKHEPIPIMDLIFRIHKWEFIPSLVLPYRKIPKVYIINNKEHTYIYNTETNRHVGIAKNTKITLAKVNYEVESINKNKIKTTTDINLFLIHEKDFDKQTKSVEQKTNLQPLSTGYSAMTVDDIKIAIEIYIYKQTRSQTNLVVLKAPYFMQYLKYQS